ncbi:MAG: hypothetical protein L7S63_02990 [Flavobacteriales bacterium]|nr:hypothetical protein [Flavobacteriales bacterium]
MRTRTSPLLLVLLLLCGLPTVMSQTGNRAMGNAIGWVDAPKSHGKWYAHWGYHRATYGQTDLQLIGPGIDLTLHDMQATDMPSEFDPKVHLNPAAFTIPQFNARIGRRLKEGVVVPGDLWISAGWDHLKYKVPHTVHTVSGFIDSTVYAPNSAFDWAWRDFNFEHSDGMNFIRIAAERNFDFGRAARTRQTWDTANQKWRFGIQTAASVGMVLCATDVRWMGIRTKHYWRICGWGASASAGAWMQYGRFRVLARLQAGWLNIGNSNFLASSDLSGETPGVDGVAGALLDASSARHAMTFIERGITVAYHFGRSGRPAADERIRTSPVR